MVQRAPSETASTAVVPCPFCRRLNRVDLGRADDRPKCGDCGRPILLDRPIQVTDVDFDQVVDRAGVPVIVDFYADWCGPCKTMAPSLDELAADRVGEILVVKLDVDRNLETARRFGIQAIPTLLVFRQGREAARRTGALGRRDLDTVVADSGPGLETEGAGEIPGS